jgi:uncharacterized protein YjhX (UPF0386 family)
MLGLLNPVSVALAAGGRFIKWASRDASAHLYRFGRQDPTAVSAALDVAMTDPSLEPDQRAASWISQGGRVPHSQDFHQRYVEVADLRRGGASVPEVSVAIDEMGLFSDEKATLRVLSSSVLGDAGATSPQNMRLRALIDS